MMRGLHVALGFVLLTGFAAFSKAYAVFPDITGTYEGDRTQTRFNCSGPGSGGQEGTMNTRFRRITYSNFDPVAGTFDVYIELDINGTFYPRTGTGQYISSTQIQRTFSGSTPIGGTVNGTATSTVGLDSTGTYVVGFGSNYGPGGASGVIDQTNVGSWKCDFTSTGNAERTSGPPVSTVTGSEVVPEAAPSNTVVKSATALTMAVSTTTAALGSRVQAALTSATRGNRPRAGGFKKVGRNWMVETPTGLSAGDTFENLGVWASYAYSSFDNDFSRTKYDGDRHMMFAGADFTPKDNMVLGVAFGYEETDIDTDFNNGQLDADGWTIAPYFGMILNDTWNIDVNAGYSDIDTDQNRSNGSITSDVDTERWFISANINGFTQVDNWFLTGRTGLLNAESEDGSFSESYASGAIASNVARNTVLLTQFNIGGEAAYSMDEFEPYVSATYNYDLHASKSRLSAGAQPSNDKDDILLGLGFRYFGDQGISMNAQWDHRAGRSDIDEDTISFTARWEF